MPEYSGQLTHVELAHVPLWLIAFLPFLGAVLNAVFGRQLQASTWAADWKKRLHIGSPAVSAVAVGVMLLAFVLTVVSWWQLVQLDADKRYLLSHCWQMLRIGSLDVSFSFAMDPLSAVMTLIITGVGTLIHVYATSYMEKEPAYWRFFCYLNLFVFSMLLLVLGDNMIVMFFGWEGVGLCSYLLIGFWYKDYKKATAGMKAFVVNRIGDWGFVCGMMCLFWGLGGIWLAGSGEFLPDYRARFLVVNAEPLALHDEGHGAEHGEHGAPKEPGAEHPKEHGSLEQPTEGVVPALAQPGDEGAVIPAQARPGQPQPGQPPRPGRGGPPRPQPPKPEDLRTQAGKLGTLTMTTHAGARVYFGVANLEQLQHVEVPDCSTLPDWNRTDVAALSHQCYAVSPFVRKTIAEGLHEVAVVPGGGAVVTGDGNEVGGLKVKIRQGKQTVITVVGPTLTFREIHDQLQVKDPDGKLFLRDALKEKSVWGIGLITLACLLFFVGATGKSAQIPLYVWLPDAMAGPTPVSALIHAATMVTAGVYMVARMNFLFGLTPSASGVVALVGALTALFAATMGFFQYDIKKVLAYSTVSQLGFMFMGVGVGAYWAGVFHLMTHAFFKACLFLGSGSVIHGMHHVIHDEVGSQDMRNMGGLRAVMPWTARTYFIACLAITAAPIPFFAGFWSKDEILWKAFNSHHTGGVPGVLIFAIGLAAAIGTSFYMWRSYYLTFEGKHALKAIPKKVKESPLPITAVLVTLAFLSTVAGVVFGISSHFTGGIGEGILPHEPLLEQWLAPVTAHQEVAMGDRGHAVMYLLMLIAVIGALGSWGLARLRYGADRPADWAEREYALPGFAMLHNKYWVDEIYQATVVRVFMKTRIVLAEMDRWIVDGIVNGAAVVFRAISWVIAVIDNHIVDGAVNFVANGILNAGQKLRGLQTGRIQNYVYGILGGVAALAIIQYFLG
jgi:NADH-quinone oxidoreductase subunit L